MPPRSKFCIAAVCGLVVAQAIASLLLPRGFSLAATTDVAQCAILLCATVALARNLWASHGRTRLFWLLMTLGASLWFSYQILWTYFEVLRRTDVPNPFVGDIVLFLHIVPMIAALVLQPDVHHDERTTRLGTLDFSLLFVWWLFLYLYAVIPWQYAHTNAAIYEHNLNAVYLTEKVVFLAGLAVLWWRSQQAWRTIYKHLFGASLTYALSSYVANWAIEHNVYFSGSLYDLPLAVSMAWLVIVAVIALRLNPTQAAARKTSSRGVWVARLGMIAISSLPLFAAWTLFDTSTPSRVRTVRLSITLACMMLMGAMVFLKQHLLDRELLSLLRASEKSFQDLRRLQAQLVQSEKLASLGQLVGGAAHELNNPLTAMLGYSDLLGSTSLTDNQRSLTENIGGQVRRTKSLVANLLSFARQVRAEKSPVDLNVIAQTAVKVCEAELRSRGIDFETVLVSGLPSVRGDSNQLLQVCTHIIHNAMQFMPAKTGKLTLRTAQEDCCIMLEICDNRTATAEPDKAVDPFHTSRGLGQGPALGLSACYGIIQEHNGRIVCRNEPTGGATFRIELPFEKMNSVSDVMRATAAAKA